MASTQKDTFAMMLEAQRQDYKSAPFTQSEMPILKNTR